MEFVAKLIGLGLRHYVKDSFNVLDGVIASIGLVDFAISISFGTSDGVDDIMSALRALRLLRVIKLARHWKEF